MLEELDFDLSEDAYPNWAAFLAAVRAARLAPARIARAALADQAHAAGHAEDRINHWPLQRAYSVGRTGQVLQRSSTRHSAASAATAPSGSESWPGFQH